MIRYALLCEHDHDFEGWFGASSDYEEQHARGLLECPVCGSKAVRKAIMAPAVAGTKARSQNNSPAQNHQMIASFSRALAQDLRRSMSDTEFDAALKSAIDEIYQASAVKVAA